MTSERARRQLAALHVMCVFDVYTLLWLGVSLFHFHLEKKEKTLLWLLSPSSHTLQSPLSLEVSFLFDAIYKQVILLRCTFRALVAVHASIATQSAKREEKKASRERNKRRVSLFPSCAINKSVHITMCSLSNITATHFYEFTLLDFSMKTL